MKIAVLWSSPNSDGLTASAKDRFISGLQCAGAQIDEIHLNRLYGRDAEAYGDESL